MRVIIIPPGIRGYFFYKWQRSFFLLVCLILPQPVYREG